MRRSAPLTLLLAVVLGACDGATHEAARSDDAPAVAVDSTRARDDGSAPPAPLVPLETFIAEGAFAHGLTRREVLARFGAPDSVSSMPTPNRHDPSVTDSVVQLHYAAARYTYYVVTQGPGEILDEASVSSNEHLRHTSPGIGTRATELRAAYGEPVTAHEGEVVYECRTCEVAEPVTFLLRDGRVSGISFDYYVD